MLYGDEKDRHMARSVLPSTARRRARTDKAQANRAHRRREGQVIGHDFEELDDQPWTIDRQLRVTQADNVDSRRGADKVGPFIRWAVASTGHLPQRDRLASISPKLPRGLIGDHALSHLRYTRELVHPSDPINRWFATPEERRSRKRRMRLRSKLVGQRLMDAVVADLDGLNHVLRRIPAEPLHGIHELDAFVAAWAGRLIRERFESPDLAELAEHLALPWRPRKAS